jgi:putative transposase
LGRSKDLIFVPEYKLDTPTRDRRFVDGALLYELRVPYGFWEAKDEEDDRRSAPQDRPAAGRVRFSCRAARHLPRAERRAMIAPEAGLSVSRQCALLGVARSSFYFRPRPESAEELELLKRLDRIFTDHPVYGSRRLQVALLREGVSIGRRRVRRLMRKLGLWALRPKRNTSNRHPEHQVDPYLLRGKTIDQPNQSLPPRKRGVGR